MSVNKDNNLFGFGWIFIADGYAIDPIDMCVYRACQQHRLLIATDDRRCIGFTLIYRNSDESSNQSNEIFIRIGGVGASEAKAYQQINLFSAPHVGEAGERREAKWLALREERRVCICRPREYASQCISAVKFVFVQHEYNIVWTTPESSAG